jgi:DNA-binding transcriptional MerR regulator
MKIEPVLSDTLTIREMCDQYDVTPRTLRFYESCGLLAPLRLGTKRLFTRRDRARMTLIERGKRFGFSLEEIGHILGVYDQTGDTAAQRQVALTLAEGRLKEMESEHLALERRLTDLRAQIQISRELLASCKTEAYA